MHIFSNPKHHLHQPASEFYRGERVPCFEKPERYDFVARALQARAYPFVDVSTYQDSSSVLTQIHSADYLQFLQSAWQQWLALDAAHSERQPFPSVWPIRTLRHDVAPANFIAQLGLYSMDNGTPLDAGTWQATKMGADCAYSAAGYTARTGQPSFVLSRPPGHHAGRDFMGGYCFINSAALCAQTLRSLGFAKVAILDVDYHHGNGTQSIFYERSDVFFASLHGDPISEYPFYLGYADERGAGDGLGYNLNLPLPVGTTAQQWFAALEIAMDKLSVFGAQALVVSLGLDTFADDPISQFKLQTSDFFVLGQKLAALQLPTVLLLEGGYAVEALGENAALVIDGFNDTFTGTRHDGK